MHDSQQKLQYIFVHGLSGWGSYDASYRRMPYWGMRGGDLIEALRADGFDCFAASVAPTGSAWDRACELYAQLAGTRVDYGLAHSTRMGHARFGRDFSSCPLIGRWDEHTRLALLGHSFGGATVRLFSELLAHGDEAERRATPPGELSPLFAGGMGERVISLAALASPMNGTTAYDLYRDPGFDAARVRVPWHSRLLARMMSLGVKPRRDGRCCDDYADYDMYVDHALAMNERMKEQAHIRYFSVPCTCTHRRDDGAWTPDMQAMEPLFVMRSLHMGCYAGDTSGGVRLDESWRENDGLVNTVSAAFPLGAPHIPFSPDHVRPGVWNVLPAFAGDHMALQGGLMRKRDIRGFYRFLLPLMDDSLNK